jgi:DNA-directed RNA polymerase subunit alpha
MNPEQHLAEISGKNDLEVEATVERGLGYVPRETLTKEKVDIGTIALDATFTPIRRVNYEVENMRVGDRTDFNRLRILIETNGTISPREALEKAIEIMIHQLKAVVGFQEEPVVSADEEEEAESAGGTGDMGKVKVSELEIPTRVANALEEAGIKTAAGLARRTASSLKEVEGVGDKAVEEIEMALGKLGLALKGE